MFRSINSTLFLAVSCAVIISVEGLPINKCGSQLFNRIIGGNDTTIDEYPWTALLRYRNHQKDKELWGCGGTFIGGRTIVTAAHCVEPSALAELGELIFVRLGEYDTSTELDCLHRPDGSDCADPPIDLQVARIFVHPDRQRYPQSKENDIALVILTSEPPYTDFIRPICLPHFNDMNDNRQYYVAGWGWTVGIVKSPSSVKQQLSVQLVNTSSCQEQYRETTINQKSQICAGGHKGTNPCRGDSGGPLMSAKDGDKWKLTGVVSYGPKICAVQGFDERPAIFTNVEYFLLWIHANAV